MINVILFLSIIKCSIFKKKLNLFNIKNEKKVWNNKWFWIVHFGAYVRLKQYFKELKIVQSI